MILLTAITSLGPRLAIKMPTGMIVFEEVKANGNRLPLTLEEALQMSGGLNRVQDFIHRNLGDPGKLELDSIPESECRIGLPFRPRNLLCIGLNYKDHLAEGEVQLPKEPIIFAKLTGCVSGPGAPIVLPSGAKEVGYEGELAVVIGRKCRNVSAMDALNYVAGYTCVNDLGARDLIRCDGQLVWAKSQDSFCPMGPYLVTGEEITDPQNLTIRSWLNAELQQDSSTNHMIFGIRELIAYITSGITLQPGDVISTGTPPKMAGARKQSFLRSGDEVVVEVEGVGRLSNPVQARHEAPYM